MQPRRYQGSYGEARSARCLVPADAFYEWARLDAKAKQPFAIAMKDGQPYALAGLWDRWKDRKAGTNLLTFTVITTDPNEVVQPMHDRMPVIIPEKDYDRWLQPGDPDRPPIDLLRPVPSSCRSPPQLRSDAAGLPPAQVDTSCLVPYKLLSCQFLMSLTGTKFAGHSSHHFIVYATRDTELARLPNEAASSEIRQSDGVAQQAIFPNGCPATC